MGTVSAVGDDQITVQTVNDQTRIVDTDDKTKFTKSAGPVWRTELQVGDRVVVHVEKRGDKLMAHMVTVGVSKPLRCSLAQNTVTDPDRNQQLVEGL